MRKDITSALKLFLDKDNLLNSMCVCVCVCHTQKAAFYQECLSRTFTWPHQLFDRRLEKLFRHQRFTFQSFLLP